jgi:hypothetical protein
MAVLTKLPRQTRHRCRGEITPPSSAIAQLRTSRCGRAIARVHDRGLQASLHLGVMAAISDGIVRRCRCGCGVFFVWFSLSSGRGRQVLVKCSSSARHVVVTWSPRCRQVVVTWSSSGRQLSAVWSSSSPSRSSLSPWPSGRRGRRVSPESELHLRSMRRRGFHMPDQEIRRVCFIHFLCVIVKRKRRYLRYP